jgi:Skp family chaperone for outer membrane proteins
VRKLFLAAAGLICLAGASYVVQNLSAQDRADKQPEKPHKTAVIDVNYVFDNYAKMKQFLEEYKGEAEEADEKAKEYMERAKTTQEVMKGLKESSPDYSKKEAELAKVKSDFEAYRSLKTKELQRKLAQMQQTVYLEVQDAIAKVSDYHGYSLVVRVVRDDSGGDMRKMQSVMNQPIVWHRAQDDMTNAVLDLLNRRYARAAGGGASGAAGGKASSKKGGVRPASSEN